MAGRSPRLYVPLSAGFFDDDEIVAVGERSAWLYLVVLARIKQLDSDGLISEQQMGRLHIRDWRRRLQPLLDFGLIDQVSPVTYRVRSWEKWNESAAERSERRAIDRDRKAKKRAGIPPGIQPDADRTDAGFRSKASKQASKQQDQSSSVRPLSTLSGL